MNMDELLLFLEAEQGVSLKVLLLLMVIIALTGDVRSQPGSSCTG